MTIRTRQAIVNSILGHLRSLNADATALLNLQKDSRIRDMLITQAIEIEKLEEVLQSIYDDIFISTASEEALELKLQDNGLTRLGGLKARLTMRIGSKTVPDRTITIPQLFEVATNDDTPIIFRVIESKSISPSTPADSKGYYTVEILAESLEESERANVNTIETVINLITSISGIDVAYNTTVGTGGRVKESIEDMRDRLIEANYTFDRGTIAWFITQTKQNFPYVREVAVVRGIYGNGTVGLYVDGYTELTPTQLQDIEDYFMDDSRSDAAGWNIEVNEITPITINITMTVYRSNSTVNETMIQTKTEEYFNTLKVGYDFIVNRYITFMLSNTPYLIDLDITVPSTSRVIVPPEQIAKLGTITITSFEEASEE